MNQLSFDFNNTKEFRFSHINKLDDVNVDVLFSNGIYLFWVHTMNGNVTHVTPTLKDELDTWYENNDDEMYNVSIDEHSVHLLDAMILNSDYLLVLQKLVTEKLGITK